MKDQKRFMVPPRSIVVLIGKKTPETAEKREKAGKASAPEKMPEVKKTPALKTGSVQG